MTTHYVVVGGGSAGCVIAGRLSEDPDCNVLLLEAGRSDRTVLCTKPGMVSIIHQVPQIKEKFDWGFYTTPRAETRHRKIPYPRGKVLGGSGALNGLFLVGGNLSNYVGWAADGCPGWSYEDVLPYFKRLETFEDGEGSHRGGSGPIQVTRARDISPVSEAFRHAVAETCNTPLNDDYNGASQEGAALFQFNQRDGRRWSSAEGYVHAHRDRGNLRVELGAQVQRILFEGDRAVGVVYTVGGAQRTVRVEGEVILCAGAIGSPTLLMRAGIGPAAHLESLGIPVRADLPVGQNLHDHMFLPLVFTAPRGGHRGTPWHFFGGMIKEFLFGGTWFGRSVFEACGFVKTDPSLDAPDLQLHSLPWAYPAPNHDAPGMPDVDRRPSLTVLPSLIYPKSRGELRLRSADPAAPPDIDPHFLEDPDDVAFLMRSARITRDILASAAIKQEIQAEIEPGPQFLDAQALRGELSNRVGTIYHPVGTCRMGSDARAVVDPSLRVRGVSGLRVVDASIMPTITGGNTNAPTMMIAEKAADLIRGLSCPSPG